MSSTENSSSSEGVSPARDPQTSVAKGGESTPPETTRQDSHPDTIIAPPPAASHEADAGGDEGGEDDGPEQAGASEGAGEGASGEPGAPGAARKRRRRRRKKGGAQGAPGTGAPGEEGTVVASADGAPAEPNAEGGAERPKGERPPRPKKQERRERPQHLAPRERPAFGVGDVVFGKIIEITDDAVFVDLSGKARGIFDRYEMDLPDEPAEEPGTTHAADDEDDASDDESSADMSADAGSAEAEHAADAAHDEATAEHSAAPTESTPADESAHDAERRVAGRRIIVAAGVKAVEAAAAQAEAHTAAPSVLEEVVAHIVASGTPEAAAHQPADIAPAEVATAAEAHEAVAAAPAAPRPAPYAPPIVLELGAHFVGLVHNDGSRGGLIVLTRHPRRIRASKLATSAAFREKSLISGLVTGVVRGGVEVDVDGLRAFAPGSHLDLRPGADLRPLVGRRLQFLVTQYGKRGRDVVLSRRPMLESEAKAHRSEALERVQVGAIVQGTVKSVVSFGAFLDIGGVEGLVTLQEMSHNRSDAPHDVFRAGETIDVRIIRMDEKGKIWLSRKSAVPDPWDDALKKYAVGTRHTGKIVRLQPFGAFVELESGIDGLIHIGDLSMKPIEHPSEVVKVGDAIDVVVAQADQVSHKIGLHPAPTGAAADEAPQRIQMRKPVKVQVMAVEPGGLVVRVLGATGRQARGYITSMATGTPRGTELRKPFPVGMILDAQVIEIDPRRGEIKLSIKALHEDTERNAYQQYRQQVTREAKFGTFGDLLAKKDAGK
jgi:small subunit ribosomal protein S1